MVPKFKSNSTHSWKLIADFIDITDFIDTAKEYCLK